MKPGLRIKGIHLFENEPLADHTSFHIGGPAQYYIEVFSWRALYTIMERLLDKCIRFFVIGAGTNILASDKGFKGAVLRLSGIFSKVKQDADYLVWGCGAKISTMIGKSASLGYGGAEFLAGIPGTIGGGVKGNAGAFGRSFADIVESVTVMTPDGRLKIIDRKGIGFRYRGSNMPDNAIILNARLRLRTRSKKMIMRDIDRMVAYRRERQPREWSAGSFFKNPSNNPAGKLIDACGLKGYRIGDAQVSSKHANFIINRGSATASDVMKLASIIKKQVRAKTGITLQMEVRLLR